MEHQPQTTLDPWAEASFEGNRRSQLIEWNSMTFIQKIDWLEEGHRLAMDFENARKSVRPIVDLPPKS